MEEAGVPGGNHRSLRVKFGNNCEEGDNAHDIGVPIPYALPFSTSAFILTDVIFGLQNGVSVVLEQFVLYVHYRRISRVSVRCSCLVSCN